MQSEPSFWAQQGRGFRRPDSNENEDTVPGLCVTIGTFTITR
ncbi:unnamed protein product [Spirodela intermedia]|uniref:Uncharacterized protein n=2 Tax=Spirodela intermedia TaxID=51605 RepID=A0A7I8LKL9_SPIIN|nr:unnamed protein product [Spirodela intermedia]CAA6672555.1 unnamed protein product [Spirodela intermedia]CAA7409818.1 unnamed protein product [Spirodela intermedia]